MARNGTYGSNDPTPDAPPRRRGFACLHPDRQREIAAMGGRAAHRSGNAHEFDSAEAAVAGRKGGLAGGRRRSADVDAQ